MKKNYLLILLLFTTLGTLFAQQEKGITGYENWLKSWTEFKPNKVVYNKATKILTGNIANDTKLYKSDTYLLVGDVFVTDSTTLTIEPGTVILGDFKTKGSLTITNGSKIIADGKSTDPIVFTSNRSVKKPGDWGGLIILGDAQTNIIDNNAKIAYGLETLDAKHISYGGDNLDSDSGILNFVRIEYAGKRTKEYGYLSALTLAGVGRKTKLNNVMVSYCQGSSFKILGGSLTLNQFVSYKSNYNDYEINYGSQCNLTNSLAVKSPYVSGPETSRALYVLNHDEVPNTDFSKCQTVVDAKNLTLYNISNDLEYDIKVGLVNEAIFIGETATFKIDKSVISGFNPAVILDNKININSDNLDKIVFSRTYFNNCNGNIFIKNKSNNEDLENWYGSRAFNNVYSKGPDSETFIDSNNAKNPDYRLRINQIVASRDD
ncbi:hypothetical protein [Lacinutrix venerupis]|uniref:T9SS C-terminal target domain-containing protein n=1 Tax=Lacinutrix venerupis TaxID=1486034 RepID=A0AAC9LM53_9FLAO|nr:hypothetical protein [Lacinutrix venerupis]APY01035.1 hypothetical protein BWR22_12190 [Lacinutrix venerupis]